MTKYGRFSGNLSDSAGSRGEQAWRTGAAGDLVARSVSEGSAAPQRPVPSLTRRASAEDSGTSDCRRAKGCAQMSIYGEISGDSSDSVGCRGEQVWHEQAGKPAPRYPPAPLRRGGRHSEA